MTGTARTPPPKSRAIYVAVASVVLAILLNGAFTVWTVQQSQGRWCAALVTLDNADKHAPPPATEAGRRLFGDFHALRLEFGCGAG